MLRLMGDNGKPNDNMLMHILSPYPADRSALTDCSKLLAAGPGARRAVVNYGFDYRDLPMDPAIEALELLASVKVKLGPPRHVFGGAVSVRTQSRPRMHPIGQICTRAPPGRSVP